MKEQSKFLSLLIIGTSASLTISTLPAQAFIETVTATFPIDIVGYTKTYTNNLGGKLTGISLSSSEFPTTFFTGDGTDSVTANYFGSLVTAGTPVSFLVDIQSPIGETNVNITNTLYVLRDKIPTPLTPNSNGGFICTTQGSGTPYQAISRARNPSSSGVITQCQGDTVGLTNQGNTPFTAYVSAQIIPSYQQDPNQLPSFLPRQAFTVNPGENPGLLQASPSASTPEPNSLFSLLTLGSMGLLRYFYKQKTKI